MQTEAVTVSIDLKKYFVRNFMLVKTVMIVQTLIGWHFYAFLNL